MIIAEWILSHVQNIVKAYYPKIEVDTTHVFERHQKRHAIDLNRPVKDLRTEDLTVIASQFNTITNEMIHEGHRERYGIPHPRCPMPQ